MKKLCSLFVIAILLFSTVAVYAQQVTVDLKDLPETARNQVINATNKQQDPGKNVKVWVDVGKEVGQAVASMAKELNVEVNAFAQTPVGRFSMFLLFYKVAGKDLLNKAMGIIGWIVMTSLLIWSFRHFHFAHKVKDKDGNIALQSYDFHSSDSRTASAVTHFLTFVAVSITAAVIVLL